MEFKVVRTSRKTLSLSVTAENEIIVRCPRYCSDERIDSFIEEKRDWLVKVLSQNTQKARANEGVINYREVIVGGERLPLIIAERNKITSSAVYVRNLKGIKKAFLKEFKEDFISYASALSKQLNFYPSEFAIKQYKGRWEVAM